MDNKLKNIYENIIRLFLIVYFIIGFYLSINAGISADEFIDRYRWNLNFEIIKYFLLGIGNQNFEILNYDWRFHGIGFHYISEIYIYIISFFIKFNNLNIETSKVLINHSFLFIVFFISGLYSKKIVELIIYDKIYSNIFLIFYLLYPYILGHSFFNTTDIPFLFAWILCTYLSLKIFLTMHTGHKINISNIFLISLLTAFLFSIRISGILILIQYLIIFLITGKQMKISLIKILKLNFINIFAFILITVLLTFLFYPIFWINPLLVIESIAQFKKIPYGVCTLTLGSCMDALKLPSTYIFIWLFFKLPMLSIIGIILFPFVEKKIFKNHHNQIVIGSLLLSIMSIIFILIFLKVNLYDEIRHLLFLVPLILIVTFSVIYFFSKKTLLYISLISIMIFAIQNINMYPYQYTWFNLFGNFTNLNSKFEIDYWGVSGRNLAKKINTNEEINKNKNNCIYVSPKHIVEPFINKKFKCIKRYLSIYPKSSEKYILVKFTRNLRRENPSNCNLVFKESYNLNLFYKKLILGEVYICN